MKNENTNLENELPSKGKLIKSTIIAIISATIILLTVVLPAEYGLDPTGIGSFIGLKRMGEIKVSLAEEAALEENNANLSLSVEPVKNTSTGNASDSEDSNKSVRSDKFTVSLEPNQGKEIKLTMLEGAKVNYRWYTDSGEANFDSHADSKELEIKYHNYEKGKQKESDGILTAAFDGNHGWFWRNRTSEPMTVTLEVSGSYSDVLKF